MANVLQTNNVDAQCDKLATELSWQRFASKVDNFQLPHLHLAPALEWPRLNFVEIFGVRKLEFLDYRVVLFAWSYAWLFQWNTDLWQTDGQLDRHTTTA